MRTWDHRSARRLVPLVAAGAAVFGLARVMRPVPIFTATGPTRPVTWPTDDDPGDARASLMERHLPSVRFNGNAFGDVIDFLRDVTGAEFRVDWPALAAAGVTGQTPVTARLRDVKVSKALHLIAAAVGRPDDPPDFFIQEPGVIACTAASVRVRRRVSRQYDVVAVLHSWGRSRPSSAAEVDSRAADVQAWLIRSVDPNSWLWNGGRLGSLGVDPGRRVLTVVQTPENQDAVASALLVLEQAELCR